MKVIELAPLSIGGVKNPFISPYYTDSIALPDKASYQLRVQSNLIL
jgi:hypothetical protein